MSSRWPKLPIAELTAGYDALPGTPHEKRRLKAVLLRCRIERITLDLPPTVVKGVGRADRVRVRLLASVGEPGLTDAVQRIRLSVVDRAATAYESLCAVLHGDSTSLYPSIRDLEVWEGDVTAAEQHFSPARPGAAPSLSSAESAIDPVDIRQPGSDDRRPTTEAGLGGIRGGGGGVAH